MQQLQQCSCKKVPFSRVDHGQRAVRATKASAFEVGLIMHPLRHVWIYVLLFDTPPCVGGIVRVAPATSWNDASTCNSGSIVHTNCITCDRTTYYYRCHERASVRLVLALRSAVCRKKKDSC